jgi:hypothetical protein
MKYFVFLFILFPALSFASAWVKEEGQFFLSPSFNYYRANDFYDKEGNKLPMGCTFEKREVQLYGEYGLTKKTTITFKLPYDELKCGTNSNSGFGDLDLGLIRQIKKGKDYSFSFYGNAIVPTGYSIKDNPRLGYGRLGVEGGLLYGRSGKFGFFDSGVGYRYYFGYPSSQIRSYATAGINLTKNIQFLTTLDLQIGLGDGKRKQIGNNVLLEPDYKLAQVYVGPRIMLGNISLVATYQQVFFGRNTGAGKGFNLSLWWSF